LAIEDEMKIPYGPKSVVIAQGVWKDHDCTFGTKEQATGFSRAEQTRHFFVRAMIAPPTGEEDVVLECILQIRPGK